MQPYYSENGITIYNADCRDVLPFLPKADLLLTDPPYGVDFMVNAAGRPVKYHSVHGNDAEFDPSHLYASASAFILWGANHYANKLPHNGRWLVWDKRCQVAPPRNQSDCELAWDSEYGAARIFYHLWDGFLRDSERGQTRLHPTQKPLALMRWCMSLKPSARTILDPFMGSGTTLRAAKDSGRQAIGIEIEEQYCEDAANRLRQEVLPYTQETVTASAQPLARNGGEVCAA